MHNKAFVWYNPAFFEVFLKENVHLFRDLSAFLLTLVLLCYMMFDRWDFAKKEKRVYYDNLSESEPTFYEKCGVFIRALLTHLTHALARGY